MKRVFFIFLIGIFVFASCEKDPNFDQMDQDFTTYTKYDTNFTFENTRVCVLDAITQITNLDPMSRGDQNPKWKNGSSQKIIDRIKSNFTNLGYTLVDEEDARNDDGSYNTDYVVKVLAAQDVTTVLYYYDPIWFYDWYDMWMWGPFYPYFPYPPYVTGYSYETGTTFINMVDVDVSEISPDSYSIRRNVAAYQRYPIRWNAVINGILGTGMDMTYELEAVDQAFAQSPYLKPKN